MIAWRQWALGGRARRVALECIIVAFVASGSYRLAFAYLAERDVPTLLAWELEPAVMFSCGHGFVHPGGASPERQRFITRQRASISCDDFAWGGAPTPAIGIALQNRYSIYGAGLAMKWGDVSWQALDGYLAFLFAAAMVSVYGLFRQATGRVLAICGVAALACSTMLAEIVALRDFVKLPCFAALWLVMAWTIRRGLAGGARSLVLPMSIAGAGVGVGIGLRMDALILAPIFVAIALVATPGFAWRDVRFKTAALAGFAVMFAVTGGPILRSMSGGSNSAHVVVLGMMREFDPALAIESAPYDIGYQYSDGFAYTVITSHALLKQGAHLPIPMGGPEYDRVGGRFLSTMAWQFPADVVTRALGATAQVFRFPFDARIRERAEQQPSFGAQPMVRAITAWRSRVLGFIEGREFVVAVVAVLLASAFNWRLGVIGLVLALYICGYSMLQFSRRHTFHLDVIPILAVAVALQLPITIGIALIREFRKGREVGVALARRFAREGFRGAVAFCCALLVLGAVIGVTRWWQQRSVARLADTTMAAQWHAASAQEEPLADSIVEHGAPIFTWSSLYQSDPERWQRAVLLRVAGVVPLGVEGTSAPDLRQQYFKVEFSNRCGASELTVVPHYTAAQHTFDHEYIRTFTVPVTGAGASHLLVPGYYHLGPTWNRLNGFAVPAEQRACVGDISRADDPAALPLPVLSLVLPPDWRDRPLYQRLTSPTVTIIGTPVAPRSS